MRSLPCAILALSLVAVAIPASAQPMFPQLATSARVSSPIIPAAMRGETMRREVRMRRRHRCDGTHNGNCRLFRHNF